MYIVYKMMNDVKMYFVLRTSTPLRAFGAIPAVFLSAEKPAPSQTLAAATTTTSTTITCSFHTSHGLIFFAVFLWRHPHIKCQGWFRRRDLFRCHGPKKSITEPSPLRRLGELP